jgi:hypothetical protein
LPDGADDPAPVAGDQAERLDRPDMLAEAVGLLLVAIGPEGLVEKDLDGGRVGGVFGLDGDEGNWGG